VAARSFALRATAWLLSGDPGRAEDLVQETLARTWQAWPRIRRADNAESYVRKVMVNLNVSWWRRRWWRESPQAALPEQPGKDLTGQADLRDAVRRALAVLPPRQRAVLVLRYYEDWTEAQTAAALGCSVGTVKSQAHRAIARLRMDPQIAELMTSFSPPRGA
jgi:RNA polymerase sigma-70 factor (sigma-E family)